MFAAIPIKRQLINQEGLAFPTGTATAETIRSIHGETARRGGRGRDAQARGARAARALFAAALAWFRDAKAAWMPFNVPGASRCRSRSPAGTAAEWTLALKTEVVLVGAGALMSFRTGWSLLLGGLLTYGVLAPSLVAQGADHGRVSYKAIVGWTVWPGAAILVASGLTSFALDWRAWRARSPASARIFAEEGKASAARPDRRRRVPRAGGSRRASSCSRRSSSC